MTLVGGEGKSFFSKALIEKISGIKINTFYYNAWKSDFYDDPMKSLLGEISFELNKKGDLTKDLEGKMIKILQNGSKILSSVLLNKVGITAEEIEIFKKLFSNINKNFFKDYNKYKEAITEFKKALEELTINNNMIIIVDELDRCKPTFAIELLEAVKHLFDIEGIMFIFLINKTQLEGAVKNLYGEVNQGEGYFNKFFDLSLELPRLNIEEYKLKEYNLDLEGALIYKDENSNYDNLEIINGHIFFNILKNIKTENFTAREINLLYKKYQIFLMSLMKNEKRNLAFSILMAYYFIYREKNKDKDKEVFYQWLGDNEEVNVQSANNTKYLAFDFEREINISDEESIKKLIFVFKLYYPD